VRRRAAWTMSAWKSAIVSLDPSPASLSCDRLANRQTSIKDAKNDSVKRKMAFPGRS
jgi:hypothetical protein